MTAALSQDSFFLGFINRWWVALGFVCVDHPGLRVRRVRQRFGQQRLGRIGRTKRREEEIDRRSRRIDGSIEVEPAAFDPDVSLIHPPGFVGRLQMRSSPLLEFRCIVLNLSPDRRMVDLHPAFNQQLLDITIRKGVSKIPADGTQNDLGSEVPPLEDLRSLQFSHDLSSVAVRSRVLATHPDQESESVADVHCSQEIALLPLKLQLAYRTAFAHRRISTENR